MEDRLSTSLAIYYGRIGHYQTMLEISNKGRANNPNKDQEFRLLSGAALKLLHRLEEAKQEFYLLEGSDRTAASILLGEVVTPDATESSAVALLLTKQSAKCKEVCQSILKKSENNASVLCICGWALLDVRSPSAMECFDKAMKLRGNQDFDCLLGKAKCHSMLGELDKALELLNLLVVKYPANCVPLMEKMNLHLALSDWEQAIEQANRIQALNASCIEGTKIKLLKALCLDGNFEEASIELKKLKLDIEKTEKKNAQIYYESSRLISRLCYKNYALLEESRALAERATELNSTNSGYFTELAHVTLLLGQVEDAIKLYKVAVKLDSTSFSALCGLTYAQLQHSLNDAVKQQIELLKELHQSGGVSPKLHFMYAFIHNKDSKLLFESLQLHANQLNAVPFGLDYLQALDPEFVLQVIKELLAQLSTKDSPQLMFILKFLKPIVQLCPGLHEARILQAQALYLNGDAANALMQLRRFTDSTEAHLLIAHILLGQNDVEGASKSIEVALSFDFSVREHPIYLLIVGKKHRHEEKFAQAISVLSSALKNASFSPLDRLNLTVELAEVYKETKQMEQSVKLVHDSQTEFENLPESRKLILIKSDLDISCGKVDMALKSLSSIQSHELYFLESRHKMAEIYLTHKKDRKMFASCYRDIVEQRPGADSQVLLGDAYMRVQEPEKAVEAYENALKRNPRNTQLVRKVGKALIRTHLYGKAVNFYTDCLKRDPTLRKDLAELLTRLKHFEKAELLLKQATSSPLASNESEEIANRCQLLLLLARVQQEAGSIPSSMSTLAEAHDLQLKLIKRLQVEGSNNLSAERAVAASISRRMAEHATCQGHSQDAIKYCREALTQKPDDTETLLLLAKLFLQTGELTQCQATCSQLLRSDQDNEAACVMMADLSFRRTDYETASFHFQQLLSRQPKFWTALARLIEVMRRSGTLENALPFLEKASSAGAEEAGLAFCQGLYHWYSGDSSQALKHFNKARRDSEWGRQAICSMIEICLHTDSNVVALGGLETCESDTRDSREAALKTAEHLLSELKPRPVSEERAIYRLLCCFLALARKEKQAAENALQELALLMAGDEVSRCSVGVTLAISTAYLILKQGTRARNQLKRVVKQTWTFEEAEYLERCWLMLADLYIQAGKLDVASELLKRVLQHNKSCTKAYECLGLITEKEQMYREAAGHYQQAWKYSNKSSPAIGYKLAYNQFKAKKYVEAIDVCHEVLTAHPNYPRIHKEILEKARNNLKT